MKLDNILEKIKTIKYFYIDQIVDDIAIILLDKEIYFYTSINDECEILEGNYYSIIKVSTVGYKDDAVNGKFKYDTEIERLYIDLKDKENRKYCLDVASIYIAIDCKINLELTQSRIKEIRTFQTRYQLCSKYIEYFRQNVEKSDLKEWNEYLTNLCFCVKKDVEISKTKLIKKKTINYFHRNMQNVIKYLDLNQGVVDVRRILRRIYDIKAEKDEVEISLETLSLILHALAPRDFTVYTRDNYSLLLKLNVIGKTNDSIEKYLEYNEFLLNKFISYIDIFIEMAIEEKRRKKFFSELENKKIRKYIYTRDVMSEKILKKLSWLTKKFDYEEFLYKNL